MTAVDDRRRHPVRPQLVVTTDDDPAITAEFRMRQPELRGAIRERTRLRAECARAGMDLSDIGVALEIDVLIADTPRAARATLLRLGTSMDGDTVRYVGTAQGLVSLILDVYVAQVADAVVLCPIDRDAGVISVTEALIAESVIPVVAQRVEHV